MHVLFSCCILTHTSDIVFVLAFAGHCRIGYSVFGCRSFLTFFFVLSNSGRRQVVMSEFFEASFVVQWSAFALCFSRHGWLFSV